MPPRPRIAPDLLARYGGPLPRYTSYPPVPRWREDFGEAGVRAALERADQEPETPFDLYVHLPFCRRRCLFCACNVVLGQKPEVVEDYLDRLERNLERILQHLPRRRRLGALHWGGGTPSHLSPVQWRRLHGLLRRHFDFAAIEEQSVEIHPTVTTPEQIRTLRDLGFDRLSLGVQDVDPGVQALVERHQTVEETEACLDLARSLGFRSVNFDLIYGLPGQSSRTWEATLRETLRLRPDRIAVYAFAWVPWMHRHQRRMLEERLPSPDDRAWFQERARQRFTAAGYVEVGFDHYALPDDPLGRAAREGCVHRNFMGFTDRPARDWLGLGMSAISRMAGSWWQDEPKLGRWNEAVDAGRLAAARGWTWNEDDRLRAGILEEILCNLQLDLKRVEAEAGRPFDEAFPGVRQQLRSMETDGLLILGEDGLRITTLGRPFARAVAALFDAWREEGDGRYSRVV